jgi:hypothetical protein
VVKKAAVAYYCYHYYSKKDSASVPIAIVVAVLVVEAVDRRHYSPIAKTLNSIRVVNSPD